jgi:hypothetical protein
MWTLAFGHHEDRTPTHGYAESREAAMTAFHNYLLDIEHIDHISDEMRAVVESEWPELAHKLPPKKPRG